MKHRALTRFPYRIIGKYIDEIIELFEGKPIPLLKEIKEKMELAAEDLRFEDAARYRDQLTSIEKYKKSNAWLTQRGDLDVLGIAVDTSMACVQLLFIRGGRLLGRENYFVNMMEIVQKRL